MSNAVPPGLPADIMERIAAARAGDEQALENIIRQYQERVAGYVGSLVGRHTVEFDDLCQVVFLKMALALPNLRSLDVFEPWLFKMHVTFVGIISGASDFATCLFPCRVTMKRSLLIKQSKTYRLDRAPSKGLLKSYQVHNRN